MNRRHSPICPSRIRGPSRTDSAQEGRSAGFHQHRADDRKAWCPMKFGLTMPNTVQVKALT
jgi:hypothetical protein